MAKSVVSSVVKSVVSSSVGPAGGISYIKTDRAFDGGNLAPLTQPDISPEGNDATLHTGRYANFLASGEYANFGDLSSWVGELQPDAMVVEGAGPAEANGVLIRSGSYLGYPNYFNADGDIYGHRIIYEQWLPNIGRYQIIFSGESTLYVADLDYASPELATWEEASGALPAPTVRRATWPDIDAAGIDRATVPLLAGAFQAEIVYLRRADSPADWTSELLDCIVAKLAADAALSVTGEYRLTQALKADYRMTIRSEARRLQSKYKTNESRMPRGFGAWRANRG